MSALSTRDALAKALAAHQPSTGADCRCGWTGDRLVAFESGRSIPEQHRAHVTDALLVSGAVVDAATLADDEAAVAAYWREREAGNTHQDPDGYYCAGFIDGYRALAAALTERELS